MTADVRTPPLPQGSDTRSTRARRGWYAAGGVVVLAVLALLAAALLRDGGETDTIVPPASPAVQSPAASAPPAPPAPPAVDRSTAVWPVSGSAVTYDDPVDAARGFAVDYLGFTSPVVGAFRQGDSRSGEVPVQPLATGPETTVLVRQLSGEQTWSVLGASTGQIEVTEPATSAVVRSPLDVRGSAQAFEGNVLVQVRQDGRTAPLGEMPMTGGGDQMRDFSGTVTFAAPTAGFGALVVLSHSAKDGSVWQAAVQRLRFGTGVAPAAADCDGFMAARPALGSGQMEVAVVYTCDPGSSAEGTPFTVYRAVPESSTVLRASLTALLAGPTAEEREAGLTSMFSASTASLLRGVTLTDGHAVVDFGDLRPVVPSASSSAGSTILLSQLDGTVFRFPTVRSAEYRIEGSCTTFTEWLQLGGCVPRTR